MKKRIFAVILTAALCIGLLPTSVLAETEGASAEQEIELMSQDSAGSDEEASEEGEDAGLFAVQEENEKEAPEEADDGIQLLDAGDEETPEDDEEIQDLAYELPVGATGQVVINLGNGNGIFNIADYTGSRHATSVDGTLLRYTTDSLADYADVNGNLTINLPSDNDLDSTFTVVDAIGTEGADDYLAAVTVDLGKEMAYDYKLIGWVNIATGDYYDVSGGATTANISLEKENVFYADWIAASYNHGSSSDADLRTDTVSTKDFVTMHMYDYNELFNLYSESVKQNVEMEVGETTLSSENVPESWTDSGKLHSSLLGSDDITKSFIFVNNGTTGYTSSTGTQKTGGMLSWPNDMIDGNIWTGTGKSPRNATTEWGITSPSSAPLDMLFDPEASSIGVHYVGEADYLFWRDEDGYYTYNSKESAATYNQSEGRFYVYNGTQEVEYTDFSCFLPYNTYGSTLSALNGSVNYWFGMDMEVNFYLPADTGIGGNLVDGKNMVFNFSGDDDILIFIDDKLVLDMSGIHDESFGSIDFTEGTITMGMSTDAEGNITDGEISDFSLSSGNHSLRVYYMERGGYASNLEVQFNVAPLWDYVTGDVQTVTAEKVWQDSDGNILDPEDIKGNYAKSVEVGLFDALELATDDTFGYTYEDGQYTVKYTDNNKVTHTYIYDENGPSLTYNEDDKEVVYNKINSSGQIVDENGYVIAWLTDSTQGEGTQTLHIRIDQQTLSSENDWYYAWELLDPDGAYEVSELSENSNYTSEIEKSNLTSYRYWSVIGDREIEQNLGDEDFTIILTDAAQQASEHLGDTQEAEGWVIVGTADGIETAKVAFSQIATLTTEEHDGTTSYEGTYGVTSQSEIEKLGPGALWYVEDSEHKDDDVGGGQVEGFYLYCKLGNGIYYLTVSDDGTTLTTTSSADQKSEFYYDSLGELRVVQDGYDRVIITAAGEVGLDVAESEADLDDGRIYTYTDTATSGFAATITNTVETVDVAGSKTWVNDSADSRPASITISLYADGEEIDDMDVTAEDGWTWKFTDLPQYNDDGTEIVYTVQESEVNGYIPTYGADEDGNTVITNSIPELSKYVSDPNYGESVDEELDEDEADNNDTLEYEIKAEHIGGAQELILHDLLDEQLDIESLDVRSVTLYYMDENGTESRQTLTDDDYKLSIGECTANCGLDKCSFEIQVENDVLAGKDADAYIVVIFDITVKETVENFNGNLVDEIDNWAGLSFFSSYLTPVEAETYSYGFDLYKYAAESEDSLAGAEFVLSKTSDDGTVYGQFEEVDNTYLLTEWVDSQDEATPIITGTDGYAVVEGLHDGTFTLTETKAPAGYEITQETTIIEIMVGEVYSNPTISVNGEAADDETVRIENTLETTDITVTKVWNDDNNQDGIRAESVQIQLMADDDPVGDAVTLDDENGWIYTWTDLPIYADGTEIAYTAEEAPVEGYDATVGSLTPVYDDDNNLLYYTITVTNTLQETEEETRDISGTKEWKDDNNKADARPEYIVVYLYQGEKLYDSKTVTAADNWTYSWTGLPKNDENGDAYIYTINEDEVKYYTPTYYGDGNFNITNTFVGEEGAKQPTSGPEKGGDNPKTGDNNNLLLWTLVMLLCGLIIAEVYLVRKRIAH